MRNFYGLVAFVAIGVAACSDGSGPSATPPQFSRQITFPDLQTKLQGLPATGAARAEIELPPTGFVAREVNVEDREEVDDHETVRGEITALTVAGDNGTLTLAPGFRVTFTSGTMFETGDDMSLTFQQFVARVQAALGQTPAVNLGVRAERAAMNQQAAHLHKAAQPERVAAQAPELIAGDTAQDPDQRCVLGLRDARQR